VATSQVIRRRVHSPTLVSLDDVAPMTDGGDGERLVNRQRALEKLLALIQTLKPADRQVILLYLEGVDAVSIGEIYKNASVSAMPEHLALITCRDFHRGQLVRQRDLLRSVWLWYLLPFVPGLLLLLIGRAAADPGGAPRVALSAMVGVLVFLGIGWLNERAARGLDREIETLDRAS
jgi:hypothetical protein